MISNQIPFALCAPFPGMDTPWSDEKLIEFAEVLDRYESELPLTKFYTEYEIEIGTDLLSVFIPVLNAKHFKREFDKITTGDIKRFRTLVKSFAGEII